MKYCFFVSLFFFSLTSFAGKQEQNKLMNSFLELKDVLRRDKVLSISTEAYQSQSRRGHGACELKELEPESLENWLKKMLNARDKRTKSLLNIAKSRFELLKLSEKVKACTLADEIPCPNCHEFIDILYLDMPDTTGKLQLIIKTYWDS